MKYAYLCYALVLVPALAGQTPGAAAERLVFETVGTETAVPEVSHIMMKMEYDAGLARDAVSGGEKRLHEFVAAAEALKVPNLTYRIVNSVIMPAGTGTGVSYSRNVVFTLTGVPAAERDSVVAKLQDIGARYGSHCVTCIGSG